MKYSKLIYGLVVFFIIIFVLYLGSPVFIVTPGNRAFLMRLGAIQEGVYSEGIHWKTPFLDSVMIYNIQTSKIEGESNAASKDLQNVTMEFAVNYDILPDEISKLYQKVGSRDVLEMRVIKPSIQESIKSTTAKYTAEELITKRAMVSNEILQEIKTKMGDWSVNISAFNIVDFMFSEDFNNAIENKVKAEQDALTEKNKLEKIKYEAQQQIEEARGQAESLNLKAKAQAEAIRIQSEAVKSQGGDDYVKLKWIERRDGKLPQTQLGEGQSYMIDLRPKP